MCPEFGSSLLLPQLIGQRRAAELLLLGQAIDAHTALNYGLINEVVDNALTTAQDWALKLVAQPATAVRVTKHLLHSIDKDAVISAIKKEEIEFIKQQQSPEMKEAIAAFKEQREANFSQFD